MSTTDTITLAQAASMVLGHLAEHGLPEPASLHLPGHPIHGPEARVQVDGRDLASTAGVLLAWAHSFAAVEVRAWRPPTGDSIHLDVKATVTGLAGSVALIVYGGVPLGPVGFLDLEPGASRPLSLSQLVTWATDNGTGVAA